MLSDDVAAHILQLFVKGKQQRMKKSENNLALSFKRIGKRILKSHKWLTNKSDLWHQYYRYWQMPDCLKPHIWPTLSWMSGESILCCTPFQQLCFWDSSECLYRPRGKTEEFAFNLQVWSNEVSTNMEQAEGSSNYDLAASLLLLPSLSAPHLPNQDVKPTQIPTQF